jgi:hypothetical protein
MPPLRQLSPFVLGGRGGVLGGCSILWILCSHYVPMCSQWCSLSYQRKGNLGNINMLSIATHFYLIIWVQSRTFITYEGGQKGSAFVLLYWEVACFLLLKFYLKKNSESFTIAKNKKLLFSINTLIYLVFFCVLKNIKGWLNICTLFLIYSRTIFTFSTSSYGWLLLWLLTKIR